MSVVSTGIYIPAILNVPDINTIFRTFIVDVMRTIP
jgi:hypothetical protein